MKSLHRTFATGTLGAVAALLSAAPSLGATLTMTFNALGPYQVVGVNYSGARAWNAGAVNSFSYFYTGQMKWTTANGKQVQTYCTQVNEHINWGQTVTYTQTGVQNVPDGPELPGPMSAVKATLLRDLFARYYYEVRASNSNNMHAAFQLLVWEISHENITALTAGAALGQLGLNKGALQANGNYNPNVVTTANSMIGELGGANDNDFRSFSAPNLVGLTHATAQDQLLVVPLPVPALLCAAGLLIAGAVRRRLR